MYPISCETIFYPEQNPLKRVDIIVSTRLNSTRYYMLSDPYNYDKTKFYKN